jgi:hypothetical protein
MRGWMSMFAAALAAVSATAESAPVSLHVVRCGDASQLRRLDDLGAAVSRLDGDLAFVFVPGEATGAFLAAGFESTRLEADTTGRTYWLVFGSPAAVAAQLQAPLRLLYAGPDFTVVSGPDSGPDPTRSGFEVAQLFRTPGRWAEPPAAPFRAAWSEDVRLDSLVARVSIDSLNASVRALQGFGTRHARKSGGVYAAAWIAARLRAYGYRDVMILPVPSLEAGNVVATLRGAGPSTEVCIVGGHYDSIVLGGLDGPEPGADDNASGTAAVLECARVCADQRFERTVRFVAFGGEELGLLGSEEYAADARRHRDQVAGMINLDMIGYRQPGDAFDLDVIVDPGSVALFQVAKQVAERYVPGFPVLMRKLLRGNSDHASFWRWGYPAVFFHEDVGAASPYIHTPADTIGTSYNDPELALATTRVAVALLGRLAGPAEVPVVLESFAARWVDAGVELSWTWAAAAAPEVRRVAVERAEDAAGPYAPCGTWESGASRVGRWVDAGARRGEPAWYRLAWNWSDGTWVRGPGLEVVPSAALDLQLWPVPVAAAPVSIRYRVGPSPSDVRLDLYDVRGRRLRQLVHAVRPAGEQVVAWDGRDAHGQRLPRGVYFLELQAGGRERLRRLVVPAR